MLESLNQVKYTFNAKDFKRYEQTKRVDVISFSCMAGELHQNLILAIGKRVMLKILMSQMDLLILQLV